MTFCFALSRLNPVRKLATAAIAGTIIKIVLMNLECSRKLGNTCTTMPNKNKEIRNPRKKAPIHYAI